MAGGISPITSHVLDAQRGLPAQGVPITLQFIPAGTSAAQETVLGRGVTNNDGRCPTLLPPTHQLQPGIYTVTFDTKSYYALHGEKSFYPFVKITFELEKIAPHYHIPLLLSPYSYTTYRGS